jgi:hypothetical protein
MSIINRGTGAGGANTNKNGLPYEELTDLRTEYKEHSSDKYSSEISFNSHPNNTLIRTNQSKMFKCMDKHIDSSIKKAHGCKNPDECYIDHNNKNLFIMEKKFQQVPGSVCEKIQTSHFKEWQYNRTLPKYNIVYIYCLSSWFKTNCQAELEYLKEHEVPVFWGDSPTYKKDIVRYIIDYITNCK